MLITVRAAVLALLVSLAPALLAQPLYFGDAVPQTHTRYGAFGAEPKLVTNGQSFFLFWATDAKVRATRLIDGQKRAGRPVLDAKYGWFDAVWTGTNFLVAAYDQRLGVDEIRGRLVSSSGEPIGDAFTIIPRFGRPRLAFDGARVLMMYGPGPETQTVMLRTDGRQATNPQPQNLGLGITTTEVAATDTGFVSVSAYVDGKVRITAFDSSGRIVSNTNFTTAPVVQRGLGIASNNKDVLAVWTNGSSPAEFVTAKANGTVSGSLPVGGTEGAVSASAAWNGTKWLVSVIANGRLQSRIIGGEALPAAVNAYTASPVSVAWQNGRTFAAWRGNGVGQPVLVRDLAASGNGETAAFTAAEQTLLNATSSHEAALAIWSEVRDGRRTLHAGTRSATDGGWYETRIGEDESVPLVSSDGGNFLVVKQTASGTWSAITLSPTLQVLASTQTITTFTPTGIAWNGSAWAIIGVSPQSNIYALRVMPWGAVLGPVLIWEHTSDHTLQNARIAWGDGSFLAVWEELGLIIQPAPGPPPTRLRGARLTEVLQRIDPTNLEVAPEQAVSPDLFWDGTRFAIYWVNDSALETRTIRTNASGSGIVRIAGAQIDTQQIRATNTPFGTMITSNDGEALLIRENALVTRYTLGNLGAKDAIVNLGPDVAYLQAETLDEMPYHGASHLLLTTGGVLPPRDLPLAPQIVRASMLDGGQLMLLEWTAPPDPINGYRIEYRVDDGTWNELDEWFDAGATAVSIRPWLENVQYHFRIRAWSDAGVSDYSRAATVRLLGRRRSVR